MVTVKRSLDSRGQFNVEYLVALVIFVSVIIFLSIQLAQAVPEFHSDSISNRVQAQAFRTTETLMKTQGVPAEWELSEARAYGFAAEPYLISRDKLTAFNTDCTEEYAETKTTLGIDPVADFRMRVSINNTDIVDCGQGRVPLQATQTVILREGFTSNGETVQMRFTLWR